MRKISFILLAVAVLALLMTGTALANFGPHGGYAADTDQCAACHRAHTSFSSITWKDWNGGNHSALLVSSASTISQFCDACHGPAAPGASTDVVDGVFEGSPGSASVLPGGGGPSTAASNAPNPATQLYVTDSQDGGALNGGAFAGGGATTSLHNMDNGDANTDPMWGYGSALPAGVNLTCTDCHDPHGSSNYRLLKDSINQVAVGGYDAGDNPTPFVVSNERGYPEGGWLKHDAGQAQMKKYYPNYTSPQLAHQDTGLANGSAAQKSLSAWCSACHTQYGQRTSAYNYGATAPADNTGNTLLTYHRHPVDITLAAGVGAGKALAVDVVATSTLPLELAWNNRPAQGTTSAAGVWNTPVTFSKNYIGCLTCHYAHGTAATMVGWASATTTSTLSSVGPVPSNLPSSTPGLTGSGTVMITGVPMLDSSRKGTNPNNSTSLLRLNNRGVCEGCHNK